MKNHKQNAVEKLFPDPLLKNQNWTYFWISSLKFYIVCFNFMPNWGLSKYNETKLQTTCFLPHIKLFFKNRKRSGTSSDLVQTSFFALYLKKNISLVIFYYLNKFDCLVVFTSWDIWQYVYCNSLLTRL